MNRLIEPKVRGFICTTAHPAGCAKNVHEQIKYVTSCPPIASGPKKVLIIGASTGYGLASRIVAAFGAQAQTIGVFLERAADDKRTASAGWYHAAAFEQAAHQAGLYAKSINGDAFSDAIKQEAISLIKQDWGGAVDLVIYSLASPRRIHPQTGIVFKSTLQPIGAAYSNKTIDIISGHLSNVCIEPATPQEVIDTVAVMGGEDWIMWMEALLEEQLLAKAAQTIAYTYLGPKLTDPIYSKGTIGEAKKDLAAASQVLQQRLRSIDGQAFIAVNKALVTQASAAIPVVPLYISLIYKVMKEKKLHEGCIEQMYRLYADRLYRQDGKVPVDLQGLIRIDDWEMREDVQQAVSELWPKVDDTNVATLTDFIGYRHEFYKLFGFEVEGVDYNQPQLIAVPIPSLEGPQ
ncbi:MAG: enoyl-ACP reductase FabV [Candidatus Cardinium sp.]|uniref:enoyl-ACP reductase FabV n=1 Tax=Candidatus Cardinium sp. TP TaxID=2961955 RepID=UPI0021AFE1DF|nr:enoyl-ACP reductase FabV [Candidatus Cardinium sp. TP]MCT4697297.1 trans-2-enoyl-CoA reductase family protein [Candidatus Cardinium sp. TP]MDN5247057.1 trans-2-enoyl-CoA reductase family protein [Candidatus Cardinium sp.]